MTDQQLSMVEAMMENPKKRIRKVSGVDGPDNEEMLRSEEVKKESDRLRGQTRRHLTSTVIV